MSRSYKKHPYCGQNCKDSKFFANQAVRRYENLPSGMAYKKVYCSYDINEYRSYRSFEDYRKREELYRQRWSWWRGKQKSEKDLYREWYTIYKRK